MKIGLVCPYNLFKDGGVQECVLSLQSDLSRRGHDVLIITFKPREIKGEIPSYVRMLGRGRDVKSPFNTTAQVSVTVDMDEVDDLFAKEKFDVLHFHEPWVPILSHQLLARSSAKNIATFHAKLPDTVMSRTIEKVVTPYTKSLLKYFSTLTAVSDAASKFVSTLTDRDIQIVPNGIDLSKYKVQKSNEIKPNTILFIGRLEKRKGLKFLLNAVKKLQQTNRRVELLIAGDGPDRAQLERYAREREISAQFLGHVSEVEKFKLLAQATVFCSPARYGESFGIVLLEAMACGLPVVAGDNLGYASVLTNTGRLSLVDPKNTAEFVRKLDIMMNDQPVRDLWKKWATGEVKQYAYKNIVDQYEKIYQT